MRPIVDFLHHGRRYTVPADGVRADARGMHACVRIDDGVGHWLSYSVRSQYWWDEAPLPIAVRNRIEEALEPYCERAVELYGDETPKARAS